MLVFQSIKFTVIRRTCLTNAAFPDLSGKFSRGGPKNYTLHLPIPREDQLGFCRYSRPGCGIYNETGAPVNFQAFPLSLETSPNTSPKLTFPALQALFSLRIKTHSPSARTLDVFPSSAFSYPDQLQILLFKPGFPDFLCSCFPLDSLSLSHIFRGGRCPHLHAGRIPVEAPLTAHRMESSGETVTPPPAPSRQVPWRHPC